ncbi:LL-diaminopimelate aminotransferase [Clostridium sp. MD294]|uniref:LL-diaminopimelate aminotransferase n=1 Tax=Clostridium sp. MD294 TaxID=97138 RepID=UPI0002CB3FB4|nr:LL-diaminopimelate aminotransferase [Clostridium sp. MD294]NDO45785.1 LL-diaminopimelate aminotransferase [Clostridium sp. MD294]USF30560.1 LL-diaminopimelate aminotransferase [Clostridium sp. MD294]
MKESYIQNLIAERLGGKKFGKDTVIYKFEKIKRARRLAEQEHPEMAMIDLGVGEPDAMADEGVIKTLAEQAAVWENRGYTDNGILEFQQAAAEYMKKVYHVEGIDPETEICHAIGSKPALAMMAQCFINPGDVTLMTVPGYPVMGTMTQWLGGEVYNIPLKKENSYLPDLKAIPKDIAKKAKLLYINYPNNPTGAFATEKFFKEVIAFAKKNSILIVQDAAYAALTFDGTKPLSILSLEGAKDVCIEVHSLSKAFNMTGWRMAFVVGNALAIKAFATVKDNNDSGQFAAIQLAGKYAMEHTEITEETNKKYSRRHDMLVETLTSLGFDVVKPKASFYLYFKVPKGIKGGERFKTGEDFSQYLIREKCISTVPWDDVEHCVRMTVTFLAYGEQEERQVMEEIKRRLSDVEFEF